MYTRKRLRTSTNLPEESEMDRNESERLVSDGAVPINEACRITGLGRTFLYQLMDRGELRYCKLGKRRLIPKMELTRLLANGLVG
jgi:excisionase family DNA binding protein